MISPDRADGARSLKPTLLLNCRGARAVYAKPLASLMSQSGNHAVPAYQEARSTARNQVFALNDYLAGLALDELSNSFDWRHQAHPQQ